MSKIQFVGKLAAGTMLLGLFTAMPTVLAGSSGTSTSTAGTLTSSGTYTYPSTVQVTITNADTSLQPIMPTFDFANAAPTFTPNPSSNGSGTFTLPSGYTAQPATSVSLDPASNSSKGIYVYDVGVPTSMQSSTYSHLFVYSNYQWSQGVDQPVDNYSTLVNLIQQLPELPLAAVIPAVIVGGMILRRRKQKNLGTLNA